MISKLRSINGTSLGVLLIIVGGGVFFKLYLDGSLSLKQCGDEGSYIMLSFASLSDVLSSHRTFGFPLVINIYELFFSHYGYWPYFQLLCYFLAVMLLFTVLVKVRVDLVVSFVTCAFLLYSKPVVLNASFMCSETISASFFIITVAFLFLYVYRRTVLAYVLLAVAVFLTYQVKPALVFLSVLVPLWAVLVSVYGAGQPLRQGVSVLWRLAPATVGPLIAFVVLRGLVVGDVGLVSFSGVTASGHATAYLNEEHLSRLPDDVQALAATILERKARMRPPCNDAGNVPGFIAKVRNEINCWNPYIMTSWLAAIELDTGKAPTPDQMEYYEPWKEAYFVLGRKTMSALTGGNPPKVGDMEPWRGSLSEFFMVSPGKNQVKIDQKLRRYALTVIGLEPVSYLRWLAGGYGEAARRFINGLISWKPYFYLILSTFLVYGIYLVNLYRKYGPRVDPLRQSFGHGYRLIALFSLITVTTLLLASIPVVALATPQVRYIDSASVLLLSTIALHTLHGVRLLRKLNREPAVRRA